MSEVKPKIRKTLRIQSRENIDVKNNSVSKEREEDQDLMNTSYEQNGINNVRNLRRGLLKPNALPKANHVIIDAMKIEEDYEFEQYELKDNLDYWYQHTKSKLTEFKEAQNQVNVNEIKSQNQQKMLLDAMKEKYKSPNLDQNILNSILHPGYSNGNLSDKQKENSPINVLKSSDRNSFSHSVKTPGSDLSEKRFRNSISTQNVQPNQPYSRGGKKLTVFNVNAANTQGNICTSLTLLQQYNPNKEYINPELVKKNNIQKIVHNIIQDKMQKIMTKPKDYFDKYQGIKTTSDLGDTVHNETLKNFKNLRKYFKYGQKIDYDILLQKLLSNKNLPSKFFHFTEDEINPASSFKDVEPELLNRYISINKAIEEKKSQQRVFRIEVAKWIEILNDNQIELTIAQNRYDELVQQANNLDKQIKRTSALQKSNAYKQKGNQKSKQVIELNDNIMNEIEKMNGQNSDLLSQQQKLSQKQQELELIINTLNQDIEAMINHIDQCDRDVEKLKISRINLKTYLRDNYIKMLKKDLTTLPSSQRENLSFVWIVKSMNNLDENIEKGAFPQFIDDISIQFLKQAAVLEQEIEDLKYKMRNQDFSKIDVSQQKKDKYEKIIGNLNKNTTKSEIQKKLKTITGECLQVKKPIFQICTDSKKHQIQWVCDYANGESATNFNHQEIAEDDIQNAVHERQRIVDAILQKQIQYQKLKDNELVRLIQQNEKREDANLLRKFINLFGTIDGATEHHNYTHLTQCFLKKVQENKSFSFMTSHRQFKIKNSSNLARSVERLSNGSSHDLKTEPGDNLSTASSKLTSSRQNLLNSTMLTNLTDKYITTLKGTKSHNQNLGNNLQIDAFDTFMGLKNKIQTPSMSRLGTAYNTLASESRSNLFKPQQTNSLRNLSINF